MRKSVLANSFRLAFLGAALLSFGHQPSCLGQSSLPDLTVVAMDNNGCDVSGDPEIVVVVRNDGSVHASAYVDLFVGLPWPPSIGDLGPYYQWVTLAAGQSQELYFAIDPMYGGSTEWIDVLIDTDQLVSESDEFNNHLDAQISIDACP